MTTKRMQRYELEAWLGDNHGLDDDQVSDLMNIADESYSYYVTSEIPSDAADADQLERDLAQASEDERDAALTAAYQVMTRPTEAVVRELAADHRRAQVEMARARAAQRQVARLVVRGDRGERGIRSQTGFARASGVDRMTVRDWLGLR